MAFSATGPSPLSAMSVFDVVQSELDRKRKQQQSDAQLAMEGSREFGQSVRAMNARQDESDFTDQQLAMTPGVTRGGSTATTGVGVTDSPLMKAASTQFERFGKIYSFNPIAAGQQQGEVAGAKVNAEDKARYDALVNIPGFTPLKAAREVYGRSGVLDIPDPHESRAALANYMLHPTRENAAAALQAGGPPSMFPSPSDFNPDGSLKAAPPKPPVPGSQAWIEEERAKYQIANEAELDRQKKLAAFRNTLTEPAKDATSSRLALDEVRKTAPRPSKAPDSPIPGLPDSGGPQYKRTVADSLEWDRDSYQPALDRFKAANIPGAPVPPETAAANDRMKMWHDRFGAGTLPNQEAPGKGLKPEVTGQGNITAADLWEQKVKEGMSAEEATAFVQKNKPPEEE